MSSSPAPDAAPARRGRWLASLASRLTALYAGVSALLVLVAVLLVWRELVRDLDREDDTLLRQNALLIDAILRESPTDPQRLLLDLCGDAVHPNAQRVLFRIVDADGRVFAATPEFPPALAAAAYPPPGDPAAGDLHGVDLESAAGVHRLAAAALRVVLPGGSPATALLALDRRGEQRLLAHYRTLLFWVIGPALLVCALLAYVLARRATAPIRSLTGRMAGIQAASLDTRLPTTSLVPELLPLVDAVNDLLQRLQASFQRLDRFSANLAHELRTPLNNLCGEIEVALAEAPSAASLTEVLRSCSEEARSLARIVDSLLFLAYTQQPGARTERQPVDVAAEVAAIVEFHEPLAADAGVELLPPPPVAARTAIDRTMLQRALANLLGNAIAFTPAGGRITTMVRAGGDHVDIEVADTGPGIAPEVRAGLREAFHPADPQRRGGRVGLGLGLTIVDSIMRLHGGRMAIDSAPGQGCRVTLRFPGGA